MEKESMEQRLRRHPVLRARIEQLLDMVENELGENAGADEVEERVIAEMRGMGRDVMQEWASEEQARVEQYWDKRQGVRRKEKKASTGKPSSGESK